MPNFRKLASSVLKIKIWSNRRKTNGKKVKDPNDTKEDKREASSSSTTTKEVIPPCELRPMYGFDNDMISLDKLMERQNAIGIVGTRGTGKSFICLRLLNKVDDVKKKFFPRVFVCMSTAIIKDDESKQAVVKGILACLGVEIENIITEDQSKCKLKELLYVLRQELTGKRYLIVLDGVKETIDWYGKLDSLTKLDFLTAFMGRESGDFAFPYGLPKGSGGTVIVTSRDEEVGKKMVGKENLHRLSPIPDPRELVYIFREPNQKKKIYDFDQLLQNLDTLPKNLIRKCNGLPLAAKLMGEIKCEVVAKKRKEEEAERKRKEEEAEKKEKEAEQIPTKQEERKEKEAEQTPTKQEERKEREAEQTPKETAQADASKPTDQAKPAPALAQGEASSKPIGQAKSEPAPAQGEATKPTDQAKLAPAPAQGEATKPTDQAKPEPAPAQGEATKPTDQAKPEPAPAQGEATKPTDQAKPEPAPAQGEATKPTDQAKPAPAPAQGEATKPTDQAKPAPAPQGEALNPTDQAKKPMEQAKPAPALAQGDASKPMEQTKPTQAPAQDEASKPIPKQTEEVGSVKPIEQTKPEQVEASKPTPKQTEEVRS